MSGFNTGSWFASNTDKYGESTYESIMDILDAIEKEVTKGHEGDFYDEYYVKDKIKTLTRLLDIEEYRF
tara:strand:+ start:340 stop:546 length:207 start_codon:yes stop_codon:yes gene_type:complete